MNILHEIDDDILILIIKLYLDIYRLSYYSNHSDQELNEIISIL